jgi:acyl-CoA synthetase (AMP-forming)/AMP-acid ligase II
MTGSSWNFADIWETVAELRPDQMAQIAGTRRLTWREFDRRSNCLAAAMVEGGLLRHARVAQYLTNVPEYMESVFACWKAGFAPVNTNYRYGNAELLYLWDDAEAEAVVFEPRFAERVNEIRRKASTVKLWVYAGDPADSPSWAIAYEDVVESCPSERMTPPWGRSPEDLVTVYTGGTTGRPKGVVWSQDDLFAILNRTARVSYPETGSLQDVQSVLSSGDSESVVLLPAPPLMHGAGSYATFAALSGGGTIVLVGGKGLSARSVLEAVEREGVTDLTIVGDAFALPLLEILESESSKWRLPALQRITSSGMVLSAVNKERLVALKNGLVCVDRLGATEAPGLASSRSTAVDTPADMATFELGPMTRVIDAEGNDVVPGTNTVGVLALGGRMPIGYHKDPKKTASTFKLIDGDRWAIPGDFAAVESNGRIRLLGRGSESINSGGEKIYAEEVEDVLRLHASVRDVVVVGVPDTHYGECVVAVIEPNGALPIDEAALISHSKQHLASYKAPRHILVVPSIGRAENGKVDYRSHRSEACSLLINQPQLKEAQ